MPNKDYAILMARYNLWQNENVLAAADSLSVMERQKERGAFFGSIEKTFSHLYWGDRIWMHRFSGSAAPDGGIPESTGLLSDWDLFLDERKAFDRYILDWTKGLSPDWFEGDLVWFSGALGREISKPKTTLIVQLFNHQTHHRGQIHAMLTAAGAKLGDTDVPFMPDHYLVL